jgi:hypothetical protein
VSLAPTNGSVHWGDWLTQQTQTTSDESPASPGFFSCPGSVWTSTQTSAPNWWNVNLGTNSFQNLTPNGPMYGVRTLDPGEQYYWYN